MATIRMDDHKKLTRSGIRPDTKLSRIAGGKINFKDKNNKIEKQRMYEI